MRGVDGVCFANGTKTNRVGTAFTTHDDVRMKIKGAWRRQESNSIAGIVGTVDVFLSVNQSEWSVVFPAIVIHEGAVFFPTSGSRGLYPVVNVQGCQSAIRIAFIEYGNGGGVAETMETMETIESEDNTETMQPIQTFETTNESKTTNQHKESNT